MSHVDDAAASIAAEYESAATDSLLAQLSFRKTAQQSALTSSEKQGFGEAFQDWLNAMAEASPVLFSVEDIQWADAATLDFLQGIVTSSLDDRILTVMACRGDFETPWGSHSGQSQMAIPALSRRHVGEILSRGNPDASPPDEFVQTVKKITKGIPSLVEGIRDGIIPV